MATPTVAALAAAATGSLPGAAVMRKTKPEASKQTTAVKADTIRGSHAGAESTSATAESHGRSRLRQARNMTSAAWARRKAVATQNHARKSGGTAAAQEAQTGAAKHVQHAWLATLTTLR